MLRFVDALLLLPLAQDDGGAPSPLPTFAMLGIIFAILYFMVLLPQKKQEDELKAVQEGLKKNDKVVTKGGIIGTVVNLKDDEVTLRVDNDKKVKMRFFRSSIVGRLSDEKAQKES